MEIKLQYSKPVLVMHGRVEDLTQASQVGGPTDAAYNVQIGIIPNTVQSS